MPNMSDSAAPANGIQSTTDQSMITAGRMGQARGNAPPPPVRHMETLPPTIDDFDTTINDEVKSFVNMSEEIGGLVAEQVRQKQWLLESVRQTFRD